MDDNLSEYKEIFVNESKENLQSLNQSLLDLEEDLENTDLLNNIFRSAHSLKGSSATMGFTNISELAHKMENVLDLMRNGRISATSDILDTIFDCFDVLEALVDEIEEGKESEIDVSLLVDKLNEIYSSGSSGQKTVESEKSEKISDINLSEDEIKQVQDALEEGCNVFRVDITLDDECDSKSVRAMMILKMLKGYGSSIASSPDIKKLERGQFDKTFGTIITTSEDLDSSESSIKKMNEVSQVELHPFSIEQAQIPKEGDVESTKNVKGASGVKGTKGLKGAKVESSVTKSVQSVRINIERLDSLMNLVGELVINKIRLLDIKTTHGLKDKDLDESVSTIDRLTTDLRDEIMQIRMLPVEHVFNRFPRMVRDLTKKRGKEINFVMTGQEIELDRTILDEIGELLVHLLRNCVDHAIELPEDREKAGKDRKGTVELTAMREKDHVIIEVNDDGGGIDAQKVKNKVLEKGLIPKSELEKLTKEELQELIFLPGISTSKEVTDISGRGVGMDAVKTKIESLGGIVRLNSTLGEGTQIKLQLPLTMAIIQAMLVTVGSQTFAIPISSISEIVTVTKNNIRRIGDHGVTTLRGKILPLRKLNDIMGLDAIVGDELTVVVIEKSNGSLGLIVDSVVSQQEVVIKSLDNILNATKGFGGATILGDGRVILILDVASLT